MKYVLLFLVLIGFASSVFAFEPAYTNYFSNPEFQTYSIIEKNYKYETPYHLSTGVLESMTMDCESTLLLLEIRTDDAGYITIHLPRVLIDSKSSISHEDDFIILLDGEETTFEETSDSVSRTLTIPFESDITRVEIIGVNYPEHAGVNACNEDHNPPYSYWFPPLKQIQSGVPVDEIQCKENLILLQKYDGSPACVTESTKEKLVERGWANIMVLNDNQREIGSYLKQVEILDKNYARMSMSYPTNDASHEIYPDDYQSIVSGCTEQNNTATLSLLYLQKIDTVQNQMIFRQENKTFDELQCDEALWQEMTEWGYCGPPHPLIFDTESLVSSIIEAQNRTDLMLDLPQYLPSGYSIQKITVEPDGESAMLYVSKKPVTNEMSACEFTWNDEGIFLFYNKPSENFDWNAKYVKYAEDPKKQLVTINDNPGYVEDRWVGDRFGMPIPQQSKVVWYINANDEIIEIHSSLSGEELIKIAESFEAGK